MFRGGETFKKYEELEEAEEARQGLFHVVKDVGGGGTGQRKRRRCQRN